MGRAFIDRCVEDLVAGTLDNVTVTASMAKLWASDALGRVVDQCVQRIYGSTNEIMKEVISRGM